MRTAQVLTPWVGTGTRTDAYRPQLGDAYTLLTCVDVTGQPAGNIIPAPNLYTVQITCDDTTMANIQADPNYQVLWVN